MVNLVTVNGRRHLVDVGFGSLCPPHPVPLEHDHEFVGVAGIHGKLEYRALKEHTDPSQRVWVYSAMAREDAPWQEMYAVAEIEFIPGDFDVMNLKTMTSPQSFFVQHVTCVRTILDPARDRAVGLLILHRDNVKQRRAGQPDTHETLETEAQRVRALEKYFGILLTPEEQGAIRGLASELGVGDARPGSGRSSAAEV